MGAGEACPHRDGGGAVPKLTVKQVENLKRRGRYGDGDGLYLRVAEGGSKQWLFRYIRDGRERQMGLGPVGEPPAGVSLAMARAMAAEARGVLREGRDPLAERERKKESEARAAEQTFQAVAEALLDDKRGEWSNAKHRAQWRTTLATYAFPAIGSLPVAAVDTRAVLSVLRPIWAAKPETASRLRGRIERVLNYAKTHGLRDSENPAAWRGHLSEVLSSPAKAKRAAGSRHQPALPWRDMGAFMAELRGRAGLAAQALEFTVLTACRTGEVLGARWKEIDLGAEVWTVPAERMKAKLEHRVPLSQPVLELLRRVRPLATGPGDYVFPGARRGAPMSQMVMLMLLRRMNPAREGAYEREGASEGERFRWRDGQTGLPITAHGFRSTFRDWAGETTGYPRDVIELALAHVRADKVEAAYARGDLFDKRARLMRDWSDYCAQPATAHAAARGHGPAHIPEAP